MDIARAKWTEDKAFIEILCLCDHLLALFSKYDSMGLG